MSSLCKGLDDDAIRTYQVLVKKDIDSIKSNTYLTSEDIDIPQKNEFIRRGLIIELSPGNYRTAHGSLIAALYNLKFLPFVNYQFVAERKVEYREDRRLMYNVSSEALIGYISKIENCDPIKSAAIHLLHSWRSLIDRFSHYQEAYILDYVSKRCENKLPLVVIEAPTGSGKTEIFTFIALLELLLGNRTVILYPRKALAEDQANRLIKYLHAVRDYIRNRDSGEWNVKHLNIAIVDGNSPESPSRISIHIKTQGTGRLSHRIPVSQMIGKSLRCPVHNIELYYDAEGRHIECEKGCKLDYLYIFKEDLKKSPGIIITNRFVLLTRLLHHGYPLEFLNGVKILILDEAHTYTNFEGGDMSHLLETLSMVLAHDVSLVFSSATMPNPQGFVQDILGSEYRRYTLIYHDYAKIANSQYAHSKTRLLVIMLLLPTPNFSTETLAQFVALTSLLWASRYGAKGLMFIDSRQEIGRLYHYLTDIILTRGGFDRRPMPGDIIYYHTRRGIEELQKANTPYDKYQVNSEALWDMIIEPRCLEDDRNFKQCVSMWRRLIGIHHALMEADEKAETMERYKSNDYRLILSTSTLELGIDIPDVSFIIQYKLPIRAESFIQRLGRAGRGDESCRIATGILLLSPIPTSAAYIYNDELFEKLVDIKNNPKPPVNVNNEKLKLRHQFYRLLLNQKKSVSITHYPNWQI